MLNTWTDKDIKFLRDNWNTLRLEDMGKHLNKSARTVGMKAKSIGLGKKNPITKPKKIIKHKPSLEITQLAYLLGKARKYKKTDQNIIEKCMKIVRQGITENMLAG